jgi:hypothetical protein
VEETSILYQKVAEITGLDRLCLKGIGTRMQNSHESGIIFTAGLLKDF